MKKIKVKYKTVWTGIHVRQMIWDSIQSTCLNESRTVIHLITTRGNGLEVISV